MSSALRRNCVMVTGSGKRTIVFGHGFGSDQTGWRRVIPRFEDAYTVVRYDLTGLGNSDKSAYDPRRYDSFEGHAEDLKGEARQEGAKAAERTRGAGEELKGKVKGAAGDFIDNEQMEAEGRAEELKGQARQRANQ